MSTMLQTSNPEAAKAIGDASLPGPGIWVVFYHRPGNHRAGMLEVPALVMKRDVDNRFLRLALFYAADDIVMKERVVRKAGTEEGWEYADDGRDPIDQPLASILEKIEAFKEEVAKVLFGDADKPEVPLFELMAQLDQRLAAVEKPAKPKRGAQG